MVIIKIIIGKTTPLSYIGSKEDEKLFGSK